MVTIIYLIKKAVTIISIKTKILSSKHKNQVYVEGEVC